MYRYTTIGIGLALYHQGARLSRGDYLATQRLGDPIPTYTMLVPAPPLLAHTRLGVTLTPRGELDKGWELLHARVEIEHGTTLERPVLMYVGEPTADPSALVHFPSPLPDVFPGMVTLALRRHS